MIRKIHESLIIITFVVAAIGTCLLVILTTTGITLSKTPRFREDEIDDYSKHSTSHLQYKEVDPPHEMEHEKLQGVSNTNNSTVSTVKNEKNRTKYKLPPKPLTFKDKINDKLAKTQDNSVQNNNTLADKTQPNNRSSYFWNMSISEREKFQQAQVDTFCHRLYKSDPRLHNNFIGTDNLDRHMLIDNRTQTAFCFAPKVGCTNLKILFFLTKGDLPSTEFDQRRDGVNQEKLELVVKNNSLRGFNQSLRRDILEHYYKFVMYRNPIERLFSAYRSKVQRIPLEGLEHDTPHYNWLKKEIYAFKHPADFVKWKSTEGQYPVDINFSDFIDYWLFRGGLKDDEHFQSIYNFCQPCLVRYNYYGNFKTFDEDANVLIKQIKSKENLLRDGYYVEEEKTSNIASQYYRQLSRKQKKLIVRNLAMDLRFFYSIFPMENNSHKVIMDTDF